MNNIRRKEIRRIEAELQTLLDDIESVKMKNRKPLIICQKAYRHQTEVKKWKKTFLILKMLFVIYRKQLTT